METKLNCSALCSSADCTIDPAMNTEDGQRLLQQLCNIQVNIMSEVKHISPVLFGMMCTLLSCGILLALFFLIFTIKFKQNRIVKMSSPNLNIVTIIGSVFTYVSGYMFGIVEEKTAEMEMSTELIFQIRIWMLCLGISLIFGPILGKTWRLYKVFGQHVPEKRVIIKDIQLLGLVAGVIGLDILILVTWGIADPLQCMESLNAGVRVVEKYLSYSITIMKCCVSQYTDIWIILISLLKGSLLFYGTYLAGLTSNVSSPPVNQTVTIMVGVYLIMFTAGIIIPITRFLSSWPNLSYGVTSGGIFICTSTINCLIFIPQVRQWKQFEEELNHTPNQMAKYFNSPSKSFRSMYSDDQIYYLLGENNSMKQLLTEKNAVIESLQEQVNNVKDKLVQLMTPDCTEEFMDYISTSGSKTAHYTLINSEVKSHNTATKDPESEKPLSGKQTNLDQTFGSQQDLKPLSLQSNFHEIMGDSKNALDSTLCPQKRPENVINYQSSHKSAQNHPGQPENSEINPEDFSNSCDTSEKASEVQTNDCVKMTPQPTDQNLVSSAIHPSIRSRSIECASVKDATKMIKNNYVSSEKLQEILQELNVNAVTSVGLPERPRQMLQNCPLEQCTQRAEQLNHCYHSISPYMVRQRKPPFYSITGSPHHYFPYSKARRIKCLVNENVSRDTIIPETIRLESIHHKRLTDENRPTSLSAALSSVKKLDALSDSNQLYAKKDQKHGDIYYSTLEGKHIMKPYSDLDVTKAHLRVEESEVGGKDGAFQIYQYDYSDSESSSSDETFCCYHRACCEACCRGSYNSSTSETSDSEQYNPSFNWPQKRFRTHPIVNFKEDLKPTFV
ncbi:probable G-protein coupled receptor 156 [Chiloscyllium plagiosum]|uniref:probable G-protein coupled receptor 156 n=1 Tax=Chiloscyllium plagiosum TaxID=36176 RepID=UPI001CB7C0F8|nr:probable G-protein coupled receptor 156 [Chiloscyllium plagiosum]